MPPVTVWAATAAALVAAVVVVVLASTGALTELFADLGVRGEDASVLSALLCTLTGLGLLGGAGALMSGQGRRLLGVFGVVAVALGGGAVLGFLLADGPTGPALPILGTLLVATGIPAATLPETSSARRWVAASERRSAERVIAGLSARRDRPGRVSGRGWAPVIAAIGLVVGAVVLMVAVVGSVAPTTAGGSQPGALNDPAPLPVERGDHEFDPALDELARACAAGDLGSCDDLYLESDVFSRYESYGSTCGGRGAQEYTGRCAAQFD